MSHLMDFVKRMRAGPLDDDEIQKMVFRPGLRSIEYKSIKAHTTLKHLLPSAACGVLILFTTSSNSGIGHFCLLFRHPRSGVHFFDPLGLGLLTVDRLTSNSDVLVRVLRTAHVQENTTKYQKLQQDVQSCGRHCAVRYNLADFTPDEYRRAILVRGMPYDDVVTLLTISPDLKKWSGLLPHRKPYGRS